MKPENVARLTQWLCVWACLSVPLTLIEVMAKADWGPQQFTDRYDAAFLEMMYITFFGYGVALLLPLLLLRRKLFAFKLRYIFIAGIIILAIMAAFRTFSLGFSHLDCGYTCSSDVFPWQKDNVISAIVFPLLAVTLGGMLWLVDWYRHPDAQ
jgi:hypothetical protein